MVPSHFSDMLAALRGTANGLMFMTLLSAGMCLDVLAPAGCMPEYVARIA